MLWWNDDLDHQHQQNSTQKEAKADQTWWRKLSWHSVCFWLGYFSKFIVIFIQQLYSGQKLNGIQQHFRKQLYILIKLKGTRIVPLSHLNRSKEILGNFAQIFSIDLFKRCLILKYWPEMNVGRSFECLFLGLPIYIAIQSKIKVLIIWNLNAN